MRRDPLDRRFRDVDQLDVVLVIDLVIEGLERQPAGAEAVVFRNQLFRDRLVFYALADFSGHEIADRGVRPAVGQDVAEIALPDAEAALGVEFFIKCLALFIGDLECPARIRRMQEAGKGLLTSGEHLGIAGLDLLLRLGVDLAVMQRCAPVRRALEYGEMPDLAGDGLDGLHTGGAGADHGNALASKIHRLLRPTRRMEGPARKRLASLDARQGGGRERADRGDQEAGADGRRPRARRSSSTSPRRSGPR